MAYEETIKPPSILPPCGNLTSKPANRLHSFISFGRLSVILLGIINRLKTTAFCFMMPGFAVAAGVGQGFKIKVFDPSQSNIEKKDTNIYLRNLFFIVPLIFALFFASSIKAATYYSRATGNWAINTTWSLTSGGGAVPAGVWPVAGDIVNIERGYTVTVNVSSACASMQFGRAGVAGAGFLTFSGASTLTVSGSVLLGNNVAGSSGTITFTNGSSMSAGSLQLGGTVSGANGTVTMTAGSSMNTGSLQLGGTVAGATGTVTMTAGGTLIVGGTIIVGFGSGTWTPGTGTVIFTATNTLPATIFTSFYNLQINGGTATLGVSLNSIAGGSLTVKAGATLALGAFNFGAATGPPILTLECGATTGSNITGSGTLNLGGDVTVGNVATGASGATIFCPVNLKATRTFTVADDGTSATDLTVSGIISGAVFGITKAGAGTMVLSGANTYTGATTVSSGILRLGAANRIANASNFILDGGIFSTGAAAGFSEQVNTLQLSGNSKIALGTGTHILSFASSDAVSWSPGTMLTVTGWTGPWNGSGTGTEGKIILGNPGLLSGQLDQVQFLRPSDGYYYPAILIYYDANNVELIPGPMSITTGTILGSPFCPGSPVNVPFTYKGKNSFPAGQTTFTAQLSDAAGLFGSPVTLGTAVSDASGTQTINGIIPPSTPPGAGYRIRVTSNLPAFTGSMNGSPLTVNAGATITLTSAPGTDNQTVCVNTPITNITYSIGGTGTGANVTGLPAGVTGNYSGGVFTISGTPTVSGIFPYTVTPVGACNLISATGTITVNSNAIITLTSGAGTNNQTVCINTPITNITYSISGGGTGAGVTGLPAGVTGVYNSGVFTISGAPTVTGTFNYIVTTTGICVQTTATGTITVNPDNTITLTSANNIQTVCVNTAIANITYTITGATGATFSGLPAGVSGIFSGGNITISGTPTVSGTFNYTVTLTGGCGVVTASGTIIVNPNATITLTSAPGTNNQSVCINTPITNITYSITGGGTGAGVTGLPAGVTGVYNAGVFTITGTPTVTGTFNYTVTTTGTCAQATAIGTITVQPNNTITLTSGNNIQTVCINTAITNITYTSTGSTGATFSGLPAGVTGSYITGNITISGIPTVSGTFNYTVTLNGGCGTVSASGTITVTANATIALTSAPGTDNQSACLNSPIINITYSIGGGGTGAGVTGLPPGVTGIYNSGVFTISGTPTATGTFNYTVTTTGVCVQTSANGTIIVNPLPSASLASSPTPICLNESSTLTATSSGGTVQRTYSGASGTINLPIPNFNTVGATSTISLNSGGLTLAITDIIQITLNITHQNDADLDIFLVDPSFTRAMLLTSDNGGAGNNYTNTILRTDAVNPITGGAAPFTGTYLQEGGINIPPDRTGAAGGNYNAVIPANALNGAPLDGAWTIRVFDDAFGNAGGILQNWSLSITRPVGVYTVVFNGPPTIGPITYSGPYNSTATCSVTPPVGINSYTITTTDAMGCSVTSAPVTVTVNPLPAAAIIAKYCAVPGHIRLIAQPFPPGYSYLWNTGATTDSIEIDVAGVYWVKVTNTVTSCSNTAFLTTATEKVTDGTFTNFVPALPSFYTEYTQNQAFYTGIPTSGLWPEGYYAVDISAWSNWPNPPQGHHTLFHGRDHTNNNSGSKNFMMVNGSTSLIGSPPHQRVIWQQTVSVLPNTDYYFSAWGMNLNPGNPAQLRFEVNGVQVGTIADLNLAPKPTTEAEVNLANWVRFYSNPTWNSGADTVAIVRIVNLNLIAGGNDFGLDDISFGTLAPIPFEFTPQANGGGPVCVGDTLFLTAGVTGGVGPLFSYLWLGPDGWTSTDSIAIRTPVTMAMAGTYTVTITDLGTNCPGITLSVAVTVNTPPIATISGNSGPVCPTSSNAYSGPADMSSYDWSITGNGIIAGSTSMDIVTVTAGPLCDSTFTLTLTIISVDGCDATCSKAVLVDDIILPVITTTAVSGNLGCNPTVVAPVFTGTDNCEGNITPQVATPGPTNNGCAYSQTWTATYTDGCGNAAIPVSITYTWTQDTGLPVITTTAVSSDLGCNPTIVAPAFTGTDNCEGAFTPLVNTPGPTNNGCAYSQTWTATYTDGCDNVAIPVSITYTWTQDASLPVITTTAVSGNLGCNPTVVAPVFTGTDNCEGNITPQVNTPGPTNNGCAYSQTWTATYTDGCGNVAIPVIITYTWTQDTGLPVITTTAVSGDLGCNPTIVAPVFTGTDNCEGAFTPLVNTPGPTNNGCAYSQTWTATYTDGCDNMAIPVSITFTWTQDAGLPVITTTAVSGNLGCNPTVVAPVFTGTDNCEGNITPQVNTPGPANNGCAFSQAWTATYTDGCGNAAVPVIITYTWMQDTVAPDITCPPDTVFMADPGETYATVSLDNPVYSDICTAVNNIIITWVMTGATPGAGVGIIPDPFQFNVDTTFITYTATDECGNSNVCQFIVVVTPNDEPNITCQGDIHQNTDPGLCTAAISPGFPITNSGTQPITYAWTMTGATLGSGIGPIVPDPYIFNRGVTTITWIASNFAGADTCQQIITVVDAEPPTFETQDSLVFCVYNIFDATYDGQPEPDADIVPDRPDWYILDGSTELDVFNIADNCCATDSCTIYWTINFSNGYPSVSDSLQPSLHGPITLWGTTDYTIVIHTITYVVKDCNGNLSDPVTIDIIIKPRPNVIKLN
jgi:autotransporter-associated beta strand protein